MARTATLPMPQNTTHPPVMSVAGAPPAPLEPDWLASQGHIFRDAPDGDTAARQLLAAALWHIASQEVTIATLQTQLWAVGQPAARPPRQAPVRPAIRAVLQERAGPMTAPQIQAALDSTRSMIKPLNDMVRDGQLTCTDGHYALAGARAVPGSGSLVPGPEPETRDQQPQTRPPRGRIKRPA